MAVLEPAVLPERNRSRNGFVFLGGLNYGPNLKALVQFDREVLPLLDANGFTDLHISVIGESSESHKRTLSGKIQLCGYVDDLDAALQGFEALIVPEVEPGGVKTKIIVAAMNHTLVLGHQTAVDGLGLETERNVLKWSSPSELAEILLQLRDGFIDVSGMTDAAFAWARENFGEQHIQALWAKNISTAIERHKECLDKNE